MATGIEKEKQSYAGTWIRMYRDIPEWIKKDPITFHLLNHFARRARRTTGKTTWRGEVIYLKPREFITGRKSVSEDLGIKEGQYRSSYRKLTQNRIIQTIRVTKRYTIGKLLNNGIFDINPEKERPSDQPSYQPSANHQSTTNKNDKNGKNVNNTAEAVGNKNTSKSSHHGIETIREILGRLEVFPQTNPLSYKKWQDHALRLAKMTGVKPTKSWFKVFRNAHLKGKTGLLEAAASYVADAENIKSKEMLFYWKFWQLLEGKNL